MKKFTTLALALCLCLTLIASCSPVSPAGSPPPTEVPNSPSAGEPSPAESPSETPASMDELYDAVYDTLKENMLASGDFEAGSFPDDRSSLPMFVITRMKKGGENFDSTLDAYGFDKDAIESFLQIQHMMNINSDNLIIIYASDLEAAKASLQAYHQGQEELWSSYLPNQYEKVQKNVLKDKGGYIYYVTNEDQLQAKLVEAIEGIIQ